jgi:hypothetical protein
MPGPSSLTVTVTRPGSSSTSTQARARSPPYVVQRRTDRRGQLPGRLFFQPNGLGRCRHRHLIRLDGQDQRPQIHVSRRAGRGTGPHQGTQRGFLLARQAPELGRRAARLRAAPLHHRQHLQHRVVDVAGQAFPFPAGRLDLDHVLALGLHLGLAPARLPYCTAQASTGPATQIPVTGITPCCRADGYCRAAVDSSRPAVTARSALSSSLVRRSGRA